MECPWGRRYLLVNHGKPQGEMVSSCPKKCLQMVDETGLLRGLDMEICLQSLQWSWHLFSPMPSFPFTVRRRHPPQWYSTCRFWMCLWHSATGPCRRVARGWKVQRAVNGRMFEKITWRHSTTFYSWWNIILETDYHWKIGCFCWAIIVVGRVQTYLVGPCWLSRCIFAQKGPHKYLYIPHGSHQDSSKFWV